MAETCKRCGICCRQTVPLTLLDIHRIARETERPAHEVFHEAVDRPAPRRSNAFAIRHTRQGHCVFQDADSGSCRIHRFKPRVCHFYPCGRDLVLNPERFKRQFKQAITPPLFWEHKLAEEATEIYITRHGKDWCPESFDKLIAETQRRLAQKLRTLGDGDAPTT